ncbi:MAG: hypothetical protein KY452_02415 [Actinobacteria bacterium]|nr:hypothetical protein [Actinomycetota bacterium]
MDEAGSEERRGEGTPTTDEVMVALDALLEVLDENIELAKRCRRRARHLGQERHRGRAYRDIVPAGDEPLIVQMMRDNLARMGAAASQLQHAEAEALYAEGMTMEEIGKLFGVTHQRVSAMLKRARNGTAGQGR